MDMVKSYNPHIVIFTFVPTRVLYYLFDNFRESKNCPKIRVWQRVLSNMRKVTCSMEQAGLLFTCYYNTGFNQLSHLEKKRTLIHIEYNVAKQ